MPMTDNEFLSLILKCYKGKKVAILGYNDDGGQQRANLLRENGIEVIIGLRVDDKQWSKAVDDGFKVLPHWEATESSEVAQVW